MKHVGGDISRGMARGDEGSSRGGGSRGLSREAFACRFREVSSRLHCVALAIVGDPGSAEDLVQDAAVVAMERLDEFTPGTSFGAWMSQIVRYTALNHRRKTARRARAPLDAVRRVDATRDEAVPIDDRGRLITDQTSFDDAVVAALERLEEIPRACLLLRTTMDLSYREIGELLGIPEGTAMSHVHRARRRMREALTDGAEETRR